MDTTKTLRLSALTLLVAGTLVAGPAVAAVTIDPVEDVMTSSFFSGANTVRGYAGDNRPVFRVSTDNPFGTSGAETIYITFDAADFDSFSGPVKASLFVESVVGGFNADADAANPFTVSAHAVSANPLVSITDDTNPSGTIHWLDFYHGNILAAAPAAQTVIDSFGQYSFDVSAIVNDWISRGNTHFAIALTGLNDTSGVEFLHGFRNNTEAPGSTFLSVAPVPLPAGIWLLGSALAGMGAAARKARRAA